MIETNGTRQGNSEHGAFPMSIADESKTIPYPMNPSRTTSLDILGTGWVLGVSICFMFDALMRVILSVVSLAFIMTYVLIALGLFMSLFSDF